MIQDNFIQIFPGFYVPFNNIACFHSESENPEEMESIQLIHPIVGVYQYLRAYGFFTDADEVVFDKNGNLHPSYSNIQEVPVKRISRPNDTSENSKTPRMIYRANSHFSRK